MPSQQQREFELTLPSVNENPAERRRILNILAQRRYRDRKRARLAKLEAQARQAPSDGAQSLSSGDHLSQSPPQSVDELRAAAKAIKRESHGGISGSGAFESMPLNQYPYFEDDMSSTPTSPTAQHTRPSTGFSSSSRSIYDHSMPINVATQPEVYPPIPAYNPFPSPPYSQQPAGYNSRTTRANVSPPQKLSRSPNSTTPDSTSSLSQSTAYFSLPELGLVKAHFEILQRIQKSVRAKVISVWDPHSVSPFYRQEPLSPSNMPLSDVLPCNFQPTTHQILIKHHPVFDLLPWPAVRSRILTTLNTPIDARPIWIKGNPADIVARFVLDMRDPHGGLRVWGNDPFDESYWEIGQLFYDRWGWAFDSEIIQRSNQLRRMRGDPPLHTASIAAKRYA